MKFQAIKFSSLLLAVVGTLSSSCQGNLGDCSRKPRVMACSEKTSEETARRAMEDHDYDLAIEVLLPATEALVGRADLDDAERYRLHPLFSAAYAARAGFSILTTVLNQASGSSGGGLIEQLSSLVPSPTGLEATQYADLITDMRRAADVLLQIPSVLLEETKETSFGKSAALQLTLYQAAYSIMLMNQFILSPTTGGFDPSRLDTMTPADAEAILEALSGAGQVPGVDSPELQAQIDAALAAIDASPGASRRDKLADYLAKNGGSASP